MRITGSVRYVDGQNDPAVLHGDDYTEPYQRNPDYEGRSVLGVIARDDIACAPARPPGARSTRGCSARAAGSASTASPRGANGEPTKDCLNGLTAAEREKEDACDRTGCGTRRSCRESLRRFAGLESDERILETFIRPGAAGTAYVDSGFKRGVVKLGFNLLFNPPPNFVQVPRPVVTSVVPVCLMRNRDE